MRRGGYLTRPVLRFKGGTALTPLEGFKLGLKPFRGERRVRVYVFSRASTAKSSLEMVENLANGVKGYGGMSSWFNCDLEGEGVVKVQSNEDYVKAAVSRLRSSGVEVDYRHASRIAEELRRRFQGRLSVTIAALAAWMASGRALPLSRVAGITGASHTSLYKLARKL